MSRQRCQVVLALVLGMSVLVTPCLGESVKELVASNEGSRVNLKRVHEMESGDMQFYFEVQVSGRETVILRLENQTRRIESLHLFDTKLVVFGFVDSSVSGVTIVDLEKLHAIDFLLCYHPEPSSTGRYIAYRKFYPRFAPPEVRSDLVLVYDLVRSPQENRLGNELLPDSFQPGTSDYLGVSERVGFPIYPLQNAQGRTYRIWVKADEGRQHVTSEFLWDRQDTWVLFTVTEGENKKRKFVVIVDLSKGLTDPKVARLSLDDTSFQGIDR